MTPDFKNLFATGRRSRHAGFLLVYSDNWVETQESRWAVVASKKSVHKKAVIRNRTKRRLRALVSELSRNQAQLPGQWCLLGNRSTATCSWKVLRENLALFLQTAGQQPKKAEIHVPS